MGYPVYVTSAIQAVMDERDRQDAKWGQQNHAPEWWLAILGEEFGEACKAVLDSLPGSKYQKATLDDYRTELVQVAAVAVAAIEALDRNRVGAVVHLAGLNVSALGTEGVDA